MYDGGVMTAFFPWTGAKGPTEKRDVCGISAHKYNPLTVYSRVLFWPNTLPALLTSPQTITAKLEGPREGAVGESWGGKKGHTWARWGSEGHTG